MGKSYRKIYAKPGESINLGREVENNARQIYFKISDWAKLFGEGSVQLIARRPDEAEPYPVSITMDGDYAVWTVSNSDTAIPGRGNCELHYYAGDTLEKSDTWVTVIADTLGEPTETPPAPYQNYVDQVLAAGAAAESAAERAEAALLRQPIPNAETGTWWVWNAATEAYVDSGEHYASGDTVLYTEQLLTEAQRKQARENIGAGVPQIQADYEQNDETADDFVKHKTHYDTREAKKVVIEWDVNTEGLVQLNFRGKVYYKVSDRIPSYEQLVGGELVMQSAGTDKVYTLGYANASGEGELPLMQLRDVVYMGTIQSPYAIVVTAIGAETNNTETGIYFRYASATTYISSLTYTEGELKQLDPKYIPTEIARLSNVVPTPATAEVGQTIIVKAVDENGKPTAWEAANLADLLALTSPSGTKYQISVADDGTLTTAVVE